MTAQVQIQVRIPPDLLRRLDDMKRRVSTERGADVSRNAYLLEVLDRALAEESSRWCDRSAQAHAEAIERLGFDEAVRQAAAREVRGAE